MASPLHDNPRSRSEEKKKPEEKPDEKSATEKKAAEKAKPEEKKPEGEEKPEGDEEASAGDKFAEGMSKIEKRHEGERRDAHGNHREMLRQMASRHAKEIADHFDMSLKPGEAAEGEGAPAAGGAAPEAPPEE